MASTSSAEGARQNSPDKEKLVTVLSIDGGGIRGIIPATILAFLEEELKVRYLEVHLPFHRYACLLFPEEHWICVV